MLRRVLSRFFHSGSFKVEGGDVEEDGLGALLLPPRLHISLADPRLKPMLLRRLKLRLWRKKMRMWFHLHASGLLRALKLM